MKLVLALLAILVFSRKQPHHYKLPHHRRHHRESLVTPPEPKINLTLPVNTAAAHAFQDDSREHLVVDLPDLPFGYKHDMYAGELSVEEPTLSNKGSIFYWLLESQDSPSKDPLLIWLNGGPGCSSMEGLLIEHGPFLASERGFDLELNFFAWNRNANVLYVDQPVGTGFARAENGQYARSQEDVNVMFIAFLQRWMKMHSRYRNRPIYLAGESYAGRYIPHFVHAMDRAGGFNIQGILIGNGWTHPIVQSQALIEYSVGHGILSPHQKVVVDKLMSACQASYDADPYSNETWVACEKIQTVPPALSGNSQIGRVNIYDVRLYDRSSGEEWPWRATGEHAYLNRQDVREALHVRTKLVWDECSDEVEEALTHEDMYPTVKEFEALLPRMRVLVYNGQFDWICNHLGVEQFLNKLEYSGRENFEKRGLWVTGSRLAGYVNTGGNLTYVLVLGGSHMVPMDKRPETFDLITRFLQNLSLTDVHLLPESAPEPIIKRSIPDVMHQQQLKVSEEFERVGPLSSSKKTHLAAWGRLDSGLGTDLEPSAGFFSTHSSLILLLLVGVTVVCWFSLLRKRTGYTPM